MLKKITVSLLVAFILSSCALMSTSNIGRKALKYQRIPLESTVGEQRQWQAKDVILHYSMENSDDFFHISGTLQIKESILMSFPVSESFHLYINFLDNEGVVIDTVDISPLLRYKKEVLQNLPLNYKLAVLPNAHAYNFSYTGIFRSPYGSDHSMGTWHFDYLPFEPKR